MVAFVLRLHVYWMGKRQLFGFPFLHTMMSLGGIPVERETSSNLVAASVDAIKAFYASFKGKNADQVHADGETLPGPPYNQ